jgi:hypothetical protein
MSDANVVTLHAFEDTEALAWLRAHLDGSSEWSVKDLARQFRWPTPRLRRRLAAWAKAGAISRRSSGKGKVVIELAEGTRGPPRRRQPVQPAPAPPEAAALPAPTNAGTQPAAAPAPVAPHSVLTAGMVVLLLASAMSLAAVGLAMNARFAASFGQTMEASILLAAIGLAIDLLAVLLPAVGAILWQRRSRAAAVMAWTIWTVALTMTFLAAMGFAATNIGDAVAGRARIAEETSALTHKLERLRSARAAISETAAADAITAALQQAQPAAQAVWRITDGCRDVTRLASGRACATVLDLRERLATARRRDAIEAELNAAEARWAALPAVALADPQATTAAEMITWLSAGRLRPTARDIHRLRTIGLTIAPGLAGLIAMLALSLARSRDPARRPMAAAGAAGALACG